MLSGMGVFFTTCQFAHACYNGATAKGLYMNYSQHNAITNFIWSAAGIQKRRFFKRNIRNY
jgi:hypothetical protein